MILTVPSSEASCWARSRSASVSVSSTRSPPPKPSLNGASPLSSRKGIFAVVRSSRTLSEVRASDIHLAKRALYLVLVFRSHWTAAFAASCGSEAVIRSSSLCCSSGLSMASAEAVSSPVIHRRMVVEARTYRSSCLIVSPRLPRMLRERPACISQRSNSEGCQ